MPRDVFRNLPGLKFIDRIGFRASIIARFSGVWKTGLAREENIGVGCFWFQFMIQDATPFFLVPPKSAVGKAVAYSLGQWDKLVRYTENGHLKIDNNRAERAIKPFVIGRKNWLFSNTAKGAQSSAILYSLIETAKANGMIPYDYLNHLLKELSQKPDDIDYLLPWNINSAQLDEK